VILSLRQENWLKYLAEGPVASESFMESAEDLPVQERNRQDEVFVRRDNATGY
jgi:virulence-associated protein VagC